MIIHPIQFNAWVFAASLGVAFTSSGTLFGAALGLTIGTGFTLVINLLPSR